MRLFLEIPQHLLWVVGGVHVRIGPHYFPIAIDQIADPLGILGVGAVASPIRQADRTARIGKQRKIEVELLGKGGVLLRSIETDSEDLYPFVGVLLATVAEPATLRGSPGGVGLGIEPQDDPLAAEV